jgi:hypothetical protein
LALDECIRRVWFGGVKVFTDQPRDGEILADKFSDLWQAGRFTTHEVPKYISTSHALFIHWDSWVVNASAWRPEFLECDYVGAPWWYEDGFNVGNSGFCLRSKRLMDFLAAYADDFPMGMPEDHVLCREHRRRLPQFRWADEDLAWRFSFERTMKFPPREVFGFHGMFNFPFVISDDEIERRVAMAPEYVTTRVEYSQMRQTMARRAVARRAVARRA